jgi:hypothetical protein
MLYLELGCTRFRDMIRKRRLSFLYYILNEPSDLLVNSFFVVQLRTRTVLNDLELLGIDKSFAENKEMKKSSYNSLLSKAINNVAFKGFETLKLSHSKVENVKHKMLKMRIYDKMTVLCVEGKRIHRFTY